MSRYDRNARCSSQHTCQNAYNVERRHFFYQKTI
ncbi:hypothetical protein T06_4077 [Trichinella sp. T6]|nr:hypothetical protein T06_4077 [Trichinella sp. T6]